MDIINHTRNNGIIILFLILITINLANSVFAESKTVHGLLKKIDSNGATDNVSCFYDAETNNCFIFNPQSLDYYIVGDAQIYIELNGNTKPNLVIDDPNANNSDRRVLFLKAKCIKYSDGGMIQTTPPGEDSTLCVEKNAEINITNFNSIVVPSNNEFSISSFIPNNIKISGQISTLQEDSNFSLYFKQDYNRCIDINNETNLEYFSELYLPIIDLSEATINNRGSFNIVSRSSIYAASSTDDTNLCSTGGKNNSETELSVYNTEIIIGDLNNSGTVNISGGVLPLNNSIEDITLMEPIFNINFNNYSGVIPKELTFDLIPSIQNFSKIRLSTCDTLSIPAGIEYRKICKFIYIRDTNNYLNLNVNNIGLSNEKIISLSNSCRNVNISGHISNYLFTNDSNIESKPLIFGTINSAANSQPIDISLTTTDSNAGLYNTKSLNQKISTISHTENTFFKLFLPNNHFTDTNLLDSYLFRFKLISNPAEGYPDIRLDYPFKIHK